jgi:hypothetical protein
MLLEVMYSNNSKIRLDTKVCLGWFRKNHYMLPLYWGLRTKQIIRTFLPRHKKGLKKLHGVRFHMNNQEQRRVVVVEVYMERQLLPQ